MARSFPSPPPLNLLHCFLSPKEEHDRILVDLNLTILFTAINGQRPPTSPRFADHLQARYGGYNSDWSPVTVDNGFLLKVPNWISQDEIEGDAPYWESLCSLTTQPWQTQLRSDPLPPPIRVHLTIHDFPLDYWHPLYFRQAVSGLGIMVGVSQDALRGFNKAVLCLWVDCYDLNLIPTTLRVCHESGWSDCLVEWQDGASPTFTLPPPPPHSGADSTRVPPEVLHQAQLVRPYIPPCRRNQLLRRVLNEAPFRRGAPAAQQGFSGLWSTDRGYGPRPGEEPTQTRACSPRGVKSRQKSDQNQTPLTYSSVSLRRAVEISGEESLKTNYNCHPTSISGRFPVKDCITKERVDTCPWRGFQTKVNREEFYKGKVTASTKDTPTDLKVNKPSDLLACSLSHLSNLSSKTLAKPLSTKTPDKPLSFMAEFTPDDEAFIQRFIGLDTSDNPHPIVKVPSEAATSTDWSRAILVKVVTDRTVLDNPFSEAMSRAWDAHPNTVFRSVSRNCFLVEFYRVSDMDTALLAGP